MRIGHGQLGGGGGRALVNTKRAELTNERITGDVENMSQHGFGRIGRGHNFLLIIDGDERAGITFDRAGNDLYEKLKQLFDPDGLFRIIVSSGGSKADRNQVPLTNCLAECLLQLFRLDLPLFEVSFHQSVVDFDHLFDQVRVGIGHRT